MNNEGSKVFASAADRSLPQPPTSSAGTGHSNGTRELPWGGAMLSAGPIGRA